jgi:hypothetical protein
VIGFNCKSLSVWFGRMIDHWYFYFEAFMGFQMAALSCGNRLRSDIMTGVAPVGVSAGALSSPRKGTFSQRKSWRHLVMVETMAGGQNHWWQLTGSTKQPRVNNGCVFCRFLQVWIGARVPPSANNYLRFRFFGELHRTPHATLPPQ